ncbi:hypothetical protein HDA32_005603 [Spinactinospora alkalitolerans]|uniref:Uncharacterized protein n=1 Tax=Spinactinospora alkalitolerans TaxID=687207 RepID=A0A852U6I6_9ACTN|nr:hypothetical protein [Spinactinospora alkalitolerans]NYE50483.1 hypothetical protein [Spinactinospora alkalitolerans]
MNSAETAYCFRWSSRRSRPGSPITEEEARERGESGEEFTAVAVRPGQPTPALVTVVWKNAYAATRFLDEHGRESVKYVFERVDEERLFLHRVFIRTYPDERPGLMLGDAVRVEEMRIGLDGCVSARKEQAHPRGKRHQEGKRRTRLASS